ncbi:hypothetical protein GC722_08005 [Auraticoccus sp. F435]|uniref:Glycosyltransferase n=1 Tax=Auraticoccus cholistanensis TaxID=2656650 RepID=A0A6A9UWC1_9ACTN|nr:hypothetical protein [Auraticoccus cholistanensis]MVA75965.1 hypothetical protein [Auraticoccus cholistanensis]
MTRTDTLALVESPAQLLNAVEWLSATPDIEADLVVLAPWREESRRQLRGTVELVRGPRVHVRWLEPRRSAWHAGQVAARLLPLVARARRLVLGDPFSGLIQTLLPVFPGQTVVVVDDGTATIEFASRMQAGEPMLRWHVAAPGRGQHRRAVRTTDLLRRRRLEVFTAMPLDDLGLRVRPNHYRWLRRRHPHPAVLPGAALVGSSLVETGVVRGEAYLDAVAGLVQQQGLRRYLAHRREEEAKLAAVASLGVEVQRPDLPLEVELARGPVEELVLSFPSTVLYTLPTVLAGTGVRVAGLDVPESWLVPGPRARDAHSFLERVRHRRA